MERFITTAEWGANQSKDATEDSHPIGDTLGVSLHWTGTGYGWPWAHSRCFELVQGIERSHEYGQGWGDIAYNLLGCPHGYVFDGRGANVRSAANGYTEVNMTWYAVCYLGGQGDEFTDDGKAAMHWAVDYLRREGDAGPRVNGHRDHKGTECPGDVIYHWLNSHDFDTPMEDDMPTAEEFVRELRRTPFRTYDRDKNGDRIERRFDVLQAQTHYRAKGARSAAQAALRGQADLAALIKNIPGVGDELRAAVDEIVARTSAEVERLDAEAVAEGVTDEIVARLQE